MLSTGEKADFHGWDPVKQRVKSSFPGSLSTNVWLETLSATATYRKVRTIYKHLREFDDSTAYGITFGNVNNDFLEKFQAFYFEKGNSPATTNKTINILVWFMNWATENKYNVSRDYRKFYKALEKSKKSGPEPLFLKWDELIRLWDM